MNRLEGNVERGDIPNQVLGLKTTGVMRDLICYVTWKRRFTNQKQEKKPKNNEDIAIKNAENDKQEEQ